MQSRQNPPMMPPHNPAAPAANPTVRMAPVFAVPPAPISDEPDEEEVWDDDDLTQEFDFDESSDDEPPAPVKRRRKSDIILLLLAILLMLGGGTLGIVSWINSHNQTTYTDMGNHPVIPDQVVDQQTLTAMDAKPDVGLRFVIDSVGLDVPLGEVNEVNGMLNPPGFTSVYLVRNRGVGLDNADTGTVYTVAHSLRSPGKAPGNFVINIEAGAIIVAPGATIKVGDRTYAMVSSRIVDKPDLAGETDLWANTPGMLVFITCLQYTDPSKYKNTNGHSPTNAVIIGQLIS